MANECVPDKLPKIITGEPEHTVKQYNDQIKGAGYIRDLLSKDPLDPKTRNRFIQVRDGVLNRTPETIGQAATPEETVQIMQGLGLAELAKDPKKAHLAYVTLTAAQAISSEPDPELRQKTRENWVNSLSNHASADGLGPQEVEAFVNEMSSNLMLLQDQQE